MSVPEAADPHVGETCVCLQLNESSTVWTLQITLTRKEWGTSEDVAKTRSVSWLNSGTGRAMCQLAEEEVDEQEEDEEA